MVNLLSDGEFEKLVNESSVKEGMENLNLFFTKSNSNYGKVLPLSSILIKGSEYNRSKLKERLFREGLKEYKCECCGISEWNGKYIALQLHHINGIHNDNRLSNLQILCPNCHSQTGNFSSRGKGAAIIRKVNALSREDVDLIMNTVREVGIVEARKKLSFRNSLINSVVKKYKDSIIMIDLEGTEKEFSTTMEAANYIFQTLHIGKSVEANRSSISCCLSGRQKTAAGGYKFYRRSAEE